MHLYADEDFDFHVVTALRVLGHDVLTAQDDGRQSLPDPVILARAHALGRAVLTHNRSDFERLHNQSIPHSGIASVKQHPQYPHLMAGKIDSALTGRTIGRWCIRVNRPPASPKP